MANEPPVVPKRPVIRELFGERLVDDYAWLRERDDPAVRAHLEAETARTEAILDTRTPGLRAQLYDELRGRITLVDRSVPTKDGPWVYYSRTEAEDEYARHCRRPHDPTRPFDELPEQVYVDENLLAEGHDYFDLVRLAISPNHRRCAYAVDVDGDEIFTVRVLDLDTGELLPDRLEGCGRSLTWADDQTLLYTRLDASHRPWQAWRHELRGDPGDDVCIHQEDEGKFYIALYRTRSDAFVVLSIDSQVTSEVRLLSTQAPREAPLMVAARREGVEYGVAHFGEQLFVLTNEDAQNFAVELVPLPGARGGEGARRTFIAHREDVLIEDIDAFAGHLVVWERRGGLQQIRVVPLDPMPERAGVDGQPAPGEHLVSLPDAVGSVWSGSNPEYASASLRFGYTSLTTPDSTYDYDLDTRTRTLRKRLEVVGGHDPGEYRSARVWATADDGERVPISLVWRVEPDEVERERPSGPRPLILYGYGAYGASEDPSFSRARLSLLQRGAIWASAHVRGGGELGRRWYDAGKLAHKHNTFDDFIACAEHLIATGWTSAAQLAATGGSAGGLLIGAVANARPELFTALVADVPFVDVLNTMLDPELPLTLLERDEWGDPTTTEGFGWIRAYSPYDNVRAQAYPDMFVLAGLNDTRVGYWEAAKWVARLRERKTDARELLLWLNLEAGHAGASGRFEYLHELALEYAFLIDRLGLDAALASEAKARPKMQ